MPETPLAPPTPAGNPAAAAETADLLCAFVDGLMSGVQSDMLKTVIDTDLSCTQFQTLAMLFCDDDADGCALPIHRIAELLGLSVAAAGRGVDKLLRLVLASIDARTNTTAGSSGCHSRCPAVNWLPANSRLCTIAIVNSSPGCLKRCAAN